MFEVKLNLVHEWLFQLRLNANGKLRLFHVTGLRFELLLPGILFIVYDNEIKSEDV